MALRGALNPLFGDRFPLLFTFPAVILVSLYCGAGPAVAATFLAGVGGMFLFHDRSWLPEPEFVGLIPFFVASLLVVALVETVRRGKLRERQRSRQLRVESARRQREQEISAQLRAIVESSDDAIASIDLQGRITSWNLAAERIFGRSSEEVEGKDIAMLAAPIAAEEIAETVTRIRGGGRVKTFETQLLRRDGSEIPVSLTISPIHDPGGQLAGVSYIARDISERKQFESRLLETQKRESLGVLAGGVAHDFNNLLTAIIGNASLVSERTTDGDSQQRLGAVLRAGEQAALLVQQLLAYAGKGAFVISRLDLSREIEEMNSLLRASVSREIALDFQLAQGLPPVEADAPQFRQMVMNLVVNAAEAIEGPGSISIVTRALEGKVLLEVRDTGCGMDEATKERIFDPFFTTKFAGRGLGLAAVMGIIRTCRGDIEVESHPGSGSAFRAILPAAEQAVSEKPDCG